MTAAPANSRQITPLPQTPVPAALGDERNEQQLLGAIIVKGMVDRTNAAFKKIEHFKEEYFSSKVHRVLFRAIKTVFDDGMSVEFDSVLDRLKKLESEKSPGHFAIEVVSEAFLEQTCQIQGGNIELLSQLVVLAWIRRHEDESADRVKKWARDGNLTNAQFLDKVREQSNENQLLYSALTGSRAETLTEGIAKIEAKLAQGDSDTQSAEWKWHSGFDDLDTLMGGGYMKGKVYFWAARPGGGKSLMIQAGAKAAIEQEARPFILSLEMEPLDFWQRLLVAECGIELERIRSQNMSEAEFKLLAECASRLKQHKMGDQFRVEFMRMPTLAQMRAKVAQQINEWGANMLFLDYAHFRKITPRNDKMPPSLQQGEISQWLVSIAKEFHIPAVSAAQLGRDIEHRKGEPELSDLEWSSGMEHDADFVGIFRNDTSQPTGLDYTLVNCHVVKSRYGSTGVVPLKFYKNLSRIRGF